MENYKELLTALYKEHAPEKIDQIDFYLERYKGKEKQYYITQKAKYANKRSVTDSKKILEEAMARIAKQNKAKAENKKEEKIVAHDEELVAKPKAKAKTIEKMIPVEEAKQVPEELKKDPIPEPTVEKLAEKVVTPVIDESQKEEDIAQDLPIEKGAKKEELVIEDVKESIEPIKIIDTTGLLDPSLKLVPDHKNEKAEEVIIAKEETQTFDKKEDTPPVEDKVIADETKAEAILKQEQQLSEFKKAREQLKKPQEKERKKVSVVWYFGGAAIIILAVAVFVYFAHFYKGDDHQPDPIKVEQVVLETQKVSTEETVASSQENVESTETKAEIMEPEKTTEIKTENTVKSPTIIKPTADRLYAGDFSHPSIFVACFAVKSEDLAQKKVASLKAYDLQAHYYWIPELDAKGASYFKVVVGPFQTAKDAYPSLTKVQERINFDAYLITLK